MNLSKIKPNYKKVKLRGNEALGLYPVYSEEIYWGHEPFKIVGIKKNKVQIKGDFSGGTHGVSQKDWVKIKDLFLVQTVCKERLQAGGCQVHNVHCCGGGSIITKHVKYWEE
ncbi:hypothetical protein Phi17218_110 [Cellulophaga phage phi17:2_18]|uniref:Uncharacterized protein n=2 Tax=Lightbulbvirus Cba172 TaxID=1918525 RepID=S0A099_9CAUD|nr:hypothetical protein Phi17:2_gp110 [Cellulophaga phage phi17:2]AGO47643.1 hypothetical protein Phi17:2_gp110 [Cellulophaga phage phi17:2]ALO80513.1 hypothetical protein Phi17218_110 [Cellulophaga phage phi17:2_18]